MTAAPPRRVSAIVPCYNAAPFIGNCIRSLLLQGDVLAEIICIDDCSSDTTYELLLGMQQQHPSLIRVIRNASNAGAAFSRNAGLAAASCDYIQFLDADDELLEGKLARQLQVLEQEKDKVDFIAGAFTRRQENGQEESCLPETGDAWLALLRARLGCTCSNLWSREALLEAGGFDTSLRSSQEFELMLRLLKNKARVITDNALLTLVHVRSSGSISATGRGENWKRFAVLRAGAVQWLQDNGLLADASRRQQAYQVLFDAIRLWYPFAPGEARALFKKSIPADFHPQQSATSSALYIRLYSLFGFRAAEGIKKMMGR